MSDSNAASRLLPEGVYKGVIKSQDLGETPNGSPYVELTVQLREAEGDDLKWAALDSPKTRSISLWLTPKGFDSALATLFYLGFTDPDVRRLNPDHPDPFLLTDKEVVVSCTHKDDQNGVLRENLNISRRKRLTYDEKAGLTSRLKDPFAARMAAFRIKKGLPDETPESPPAADEPAPEAHRKRRAPTGDPVEA